MNAPTRVPDGTRNMTHEEEAEWVRRAQAGKLQRADRIPLSTRLCSTFYCISPAAREDGFCEPCGYLNDGARAQFIEEGATNQDPAT